MPSLGIAFISAVLKENRHETAFIDPVAEGLTHENLKTIIKDLKTDLIGIPVFTTTYALVRELVNDIGCLRPDIKILLGGPHCSAFPVETLENIKADFLIYREGEYPALNLLNALAGNHDLKQVKSLVFRQGDAVIRNEEAGCIEDLDALPLSDRSIFKLEKYHHSGEHRGRNVLHLMSSRGCPWACAFCTTQMTFGTRIRYRSPENVYEEMVHLVKEYKADELFFYDDTLTANKKNIMALCELILKNNFKVIWGCYTRVDCVNPEMLTLMARAGCYQINYGVESGVQKLLDIIKKGFKVEQAEKAVKWTEEAGIESICNFMLALPGETREESLKTIDFALRLNPTYAQFYLTMPYVGTPLYEIAKRYGTVLTTNIDDYNKTPWEFVHYVPDNRTEKELTQLIKYAYRRFYLRPAYLIRRLRNLSRLPPDRFVKMIASGIKMTLSN